MAAQLDAMTQECELYERVGDKDVICFACAHRCLIKEGRRGICQVRFNKDGDLRVPWGYVNGVAIDPTEKKPFYHVLPGSKCLTFGMLGCDLHCAYCQNWISSQALRDPDAGSPVSQASPEGIVALGVHHHAPLVASSYNEPLITAEWGVAIFKEAHKHNMRCLMVSNGNITAEALAYLRPHLVGYKIDLKTMNDHNYRELGTKLQNILDGIKMVHESGLWVEIVTLVVPGFNNSDAELKEAAKFIASVSPDIPWHVTAFHQDYKFLATETTKAHMLLRACEIGKEAGLNYVYAGNLPGMTGDWENTYCPNCRSILVERIGFHVQKILLSVDGNCHSCGTKIPGIWA